MGTALPRALRGEMESLFGESFRDVRIYRSAPSAVAWTCGSDIYLTDPGSASDHDVLGHELAHVLQQRYGHVRRASRWRLEVAAAAAGRRVARGQSVAIGHGPCAAAASTPIRQYYTVIAPAAFVANGVAIAVPQTTLPTAATDTWPGQTKIGTSFLGAGGVNLVSGAPAGTSLRLSAGGQMAIENADLTARQPKVFYATRAVINESNSRLFIMGSRFQLVPDPAAGVQQRITVGAHTLVRVTPRNINNNTAGYAMTAQQQCDALVTNVVGAQNLVPRYEQPLNPTPHLLIEYHVARQLLAPMPGALDASSPVNLGNTMRQIAQPYGTAIRVAAGPFTNSLQQYGLNQFADPEVGEGFCTSTLLAAVANAPVMQSGMPPTYADYFHLADGNPEVIQHVRAWGSHWGGVVAKDGTDVITLENYARNTEDALAGEDSRYYFQMYSTNPGAGDTWHETWSSTPMQPIVPAPPTITIGPITHAAATREPQSPGARSFANPITLRVVAPTARFDALAAVLYQGVGIDAVMDDHNEVGAAANPDEELLAILKGLYTANVSIAGNTVRPTPTRLAWEAALVQVITTPSPFYRRNAVAVEWALRQVRKMPVNTKPVNTN
jgi:hypothetical protein